ATAVITLLGASTGALGSIQAANWSSVQLTARTIQTVKAVSVPLTAPDSGFLQGDITSSIIRAYLDNGTTSPAIGTILVAGKLGAVNQGTRVTAGQGIGTFKVGREVLNNNTTIQVDSPTGGRIGTLTVSNWSNAKLIATSLGTVSVTGYLN